MGVAIFVGSAGASTATGTDPASDNTPGEDARGDVRSYSVAYNSASITVSATTTTFENPATATNWVDWETEILYGLDTNSDDNPEFVVFYLNDGLGNVLAAVFDFVSGEFLCTATPAFNASAKSYSATFPPSCIHSPAILELSVIFEYVTATQVSADITAFTAPATAPPTTTTSTAPTSTTLPPTTTSTSTTSPHATTTLPPSTTTTTPTTMPAITTTTSTTLPPTTTSTSTTSPHATTTTTFHVTTTTTTTVPATTTTTTEPPATTTTVPGTTTTVTVAGQGATSTSTTTIQATAAPTTPTTIAGTTGNLPRSGGSEKALTALALSILVGGFSLVYQPRRRRGRAT